MTNQPANPTTTNIQNILDERQKTHGDFAVHARVTQALKLDMQVYKPTPTVLTNSQQEALDMIAHKIGRIIAGNPNHIDHWDDIAGYATLVANELRAAQHKEGEQ